MRRTAQEKIAIFHGLFRGEERFYGICNPRSGKKFVVKKPVTSNIIHAHLKGAMHMGLFLLVHDRIWAAVVDFDSMDALPPVQFVARAEHYGISAHLERSRSKGWHVWMFFRQEVLAWKVRLVIRQILSDIQSENTEIFPKQDSLGSNVAYGNFIFLPLFGALVPQGRTVFVEPGNLKPYPDQWEFLEKVQHINETTLEEIIELNDLQAETTPRTHVNSQTKAGMGGSRGGMVPCVRRILAEGVGQMQRVTCFRLAVHFRRMGFPYELVVALLKEWRLKNRPEDGKGTIRPNEIEEQAAWAYKNEYVGYGCDEPAIMAYCTSDCPVKRVHQPTRYKKPDTGQGVSR